jgi:hypothetical protein
VRDVSKVMENLGMPPIPGITQDLRTAGDVLEAVDFILEHLQEALPLATTPRIRRCSLIIIVFVVRPVLASCLVFVLFS